MALKIKERNINQNRPHLAKTVLLAALLSSGALIPESYANPEGGQVVGGDATISESGQKLDVYQQSDRAVIDWRSFNIGVDEHTQFHQPSAGAIVLNRVNDTDPSRIQGKLTANGNVILVNPNGVFFGRDSVVDVNGLVAATADIGTDDFMAGGNHFNKPGNPDAVIVNEGTITARDAGLVGLVAPHVENHGVITARMGRVHLASGDTVVADFYGDGLLKVAVADEKTAAQFVGNTGTLEAAGGTVAMTAAAARQTVDSLIIVKGELKAPTVEKRGGKIVIAAAGANRTDKQGDSGVIVQASLDAAGRDRGEQGGSIDITGDHIALLDGTMLDASGHAAPSADRTPGGGFATLTADKAVRDNAAFMAHENRAGGSIRVGGDYLGGSDTPAAKTLYVGGGVLALNDALEWGDAGRSIFWSDDTTDFNGLVLARGGVAGGHGGFLETSGKNNLLANGFADLTNRADGYGKGAYLLDPQTITIYGHVDPTFVSTDNSINLQSNLAAWLDGDDRSKVTLTYGNNLIGSITATGTAGTHTITTSANVSTYLVKGSRIRLGTTGAVTTADTLGAHTYTITNISGTTVTVAEALTTNYLIPQAVYQGLVSTWVDKSGHNANAAQATAAYRPVWVSATDGLNNRGSLRFFNSKLSSLQLTPNLNNSAGAYNSFFYTMNWAGGNGQMPFGLTSYDAYFVSDRFGYNTANSNNYSITNAAATLANKWTQVASAMYNGLIFGKNTMSINGMDQVLSLMGSNGSQTAVDSMTISGWNNNTGYKLEGSMSEMIALNAQATPEVKILLDQYQSAKWGMALDKLAGAGTEIAEATAHNIGNPNDAATNGYNIFSTRYLERLAGSADVTLRAASGIALDLKGDTLDLTGGAAAGKSITLRTDNGHITDLSTGTIRTKRTGSGAGLNGDISLIAGGTGSIVLDTTALDAQNGGHISLRAGGGVTTGAAITGGSVFMQSGAGRDVTLNNTITAANSGNALTIASGRNFINNAGAAALDATHAAGRWLVYSADPAADTRGGLSPSFKRYNKTYVGYAPGSVTESGDGFLYSIAPALTVTAQNSARAYGDANSFTYALSGFIDGDTQGSATSGAAGLASSATILSNTGSYAITSSLGTLASAYGYQFATFNPGTLTLNKAPLLVSLAQATYQRPQGMANPVFGFSYSGFKNGDTASMLDSLPRISVNANLQSLPGSYPITFMGGLDNNYAMSYDALVGYLNVGAPRSLPSTWEYVAYAPDILNGGAGQNGFSQQASSETSGSGAPASSQVNLVIASSDDEAQAAQTGIRILMKESLARTLGLTPEK